MHCKVGKRHNWEKLKLHLLYHLLAVDTGLNSQPVELLLLFALDVLFALILLRQSTKNASQHPTFDYLFAIVLGRRRQLQKILQLNP